MRHFEDSDESLVAFRAYFSSWLGAGALAGVLSAAVLSSALLGGCGDAPASLGTGGSSTGGGPSSDGDGAGGSAASGGSGGSGAGTGGVSSGGSGAGGSGGSGGASSGGHGAGGGSGGAGSAVFVCPPGSESLSPTLAAPTALPGTLPPPAGDDPNANTIVEGPLWLDGALYLSQFREYPPFPGQVLRHTGTAFEVFVPAVDTNGLAVQGDGLIVAAGYGVGGLLLIDPEAAPPSTTTLIAEYMGSRLRGPNDLAIRSDGNIYFSDPDYQCGSPCTYQTESRIYRLPAGAGALEVIPKSASNTNPNGILLSIDESTLYVSGPAGIDSYALDANGAVTSGPTAFGSGLSNVDGLAKDCAGNIYAAANGDIAVLSPAGTPVGSGTITVPNETTNAAFGGPNRTVLYITTRAQAGVYSVDLGIPGFPY